MSDTAEATETTPPVLVAYPPSGRSSRWVVEAADGRREKVDPDDGRDVRRVARVLGVEEADVRAALAAGASADPTPAPSVSAQVERRPVRIYACDGPGSGAAVLKTYDSMEDALADPDAPEFWRWEGKDRLVAVDVDVLRGRPYAASELPKFLTVAAPTPRWAWITRSGGLRLIFEDDDRRFGLTALERAGMYCLLVPEAAHCVNTQKVEVLSITRRPPPGSAVLRGVADYGVVDFVGALLRRGGFDAVPEAALSAYLASRGLEIGGRYPHTECPIDPRPSSGNDPVTVTDRGIFCFLCSNTVDAARRSPGMRYWGQLVAIEGAARTPPPPEPAVDAALHWVHWTHARLLLRAQRPRVLSEGALQAGYRGLLRVVHDDGWDDEVAARARAVFNPLLAVVRGANGTWLDAVSYEVASTVGPRTVAQLPAVDGNGVLIDRYLGSGPLPGYVPVELVAHLTDEVTWPADSPHVWVPRPITRGEPDAELTIEEAEEELAKAFPGTTREWLGLVRIHVEAAIRAQLRLALPPITVVTGTTGSGKGLAIVVAEGILGLKSARLAFDGARELAMSIGEALDSGAALLVGDELGKTSEWWAHSKPLLELEEWHTWRKLHAGHVRSAVRAAVVLQGSTLPRGLTTMSEVARRAPYVPLPRVPVAVSEKWETSGPAHFGVPSLRQLRSSPLGAAVAAAYVRAARERVWDGERARPLPTWREHAALFGAVALEEDADAQDLRETVRALYRLWIEGPDECLIEPGRRRAGWLRCWRTGKGDDQAADLLSEWVHEDDDPRSRDGRLQRLETVDVPVAIGLVGSTVDIRAVIRAHGRNVALRFESGANKRSLERRDRSLFPVPPEVR